MKISSGNTVIFIRLIAVINCIDGKFSSKILRKGYSLCRSSKYCQNISKIVKMCFQDNFGYVNARIENLIENEDAIA